MLSPTKFCTLIHNSFTWKQLFYLLWLKTLQNQLDTFVEYWNNYVQDLPLGLTPRHGFTVPAAPAVQQWPQLQSQDTWHSHWPKLTWFNHCHLHCCMACSMLGCLVDVVSHDKSCIVSNIYLLPIHKFVLDFMFLMTCLNCRTIMKGFYLLHKVQLFHYVSVPPWSLTSSPTSPFHYTGRASLLLFLLFFSSLWFQLVVATWQDLTTSATQLPCLVFCYTWQVDTLKASVQGAMLHQAIPLVIEDILAMWFLIFPWTCYWKFSPNSFDLQ